MTPEQYEDFVMRAMFLDRPDPVAAWQQHLADLKTRREIDPTGVFASDMSRRLELN